MTSSVASALLTPQELSEYLQVPVATLYQWRHRGEGPAAARIGRHLRYRRTDVDAWITTRAASAA